MIYKGDKQISKIYHGDSPISAVYWGGLLSWQTSPSFDNVITGVATPGSEVTIFGETCTADSNGNFSVQVDISDSVHLKFYQNISSNVTKLNLNRLNTSHITSLYWMFADLRNLEEVDMELCDFSKVIVASSMFVRATSLRSCKMTGFGSNPDLSPVTVTMWFINYSPVLGDIMYDIIVNRGFDRAANGYSRVKLTFQYLSNYEEEFGLTDEHIAGMYAMGYNVDLMAD